MQKSKKKSFILFLKIILIIVVFIILFVGLYFIFKYSGLLSKLNNLQELKKLILSSGFWAYSVFFVLQFLQVTILPIPASITTIVGVIIFGPLKTFLLSFCSILLGSLFAFFLGKIFGIKLLIWIFGKNKTEKFQSRIQKSKYVFFIMMLLPFFPDDILCILSGVINMNFKFFLITNIITRAIGIFCLCFLGSALYIKNLIWFILLLVVLLFFIFILIKKNKKVAALFTNKPFN